MTSSGLIYFKDGELVAESGEAKVYRMNNELYLEIGPGHNLWAMESELPDYIWQLNDKPNGACLEIGLGLGVASRYILSCPRVRSLTTVELRADVVNVHSQLSELFQENKFIEGGHKRHTILNLDGLVYMYKTKQRFDFIFIDCYELIDDDTMPLIKDMVLGARRIINPGGIIMGWLDKHTPEDLVEEFYQIFA
jgi:spermidine synthase